MKLIAFTFAIVALVLPAHSETFVFEGISLAEVVIKREGEFCETGAADKCKSNQTCFVNVFIRGEAAKGLYNALRLHGPKTWDGSGLEYVGTVSDSLTCYSSADKAYYCSFGYDGTSNQLTATKTCRSH